MRATCLECGAEFSALDPEDAIDALTEHIRDEHPDAGERSAGAES